MCVYLSANERSERDVLGVDNAKSGICYMYMCVRMVPMPLKCARGQLFTPKKHVFLGLTQVYSETTALSKPYFILKRRSVRKLLR